MSNQPRTPVYVSLAIFAWNEEATIVNTIRSLCAQTLLTELGVARKGVEVIAVLNGCTDGTAAAAEAAFAEFDPLTANAPVSFRVESLGEKGKLNAWNRFVHSLASAESQFLFMMDADIVLGTPQTLSRMLQVLEDDSEASVATDTPQKQLELKEKKSVAEQLSLGAGTLLQAADGQLCAQLYCIRAAVARRIYLPKDLFACEDGFIKALVCTDLLSHEVWPRRIRRAEGAHHTFEAYTSPRAVLRNYKRQIIGQTVVHVLVDHYLPTLPYSKRRRLAQTLRDKDREDPDWLKRLIQSHIQRTAYPWRLHPGLVGLRFQRLRAVPPARQLAALPAALSGTAASLLASFLAFRSLRAGRTQYWPKAERNGIPTTLPRRSLPALPARTPRS